MYLSGKKGINRANINDSIGKEIYEKKVKAGEKDATCIFISYRKTDLEDARSIAEYIMRCEIDVYIDFLDKKLQDATDSDDPLEVVNRIHKGIKMSTHILALISDDTRESW